MRADRLTIRRIRIVVFLVLLGASVCLAKAFWMQVVHGTAWRETAERSYTATLTLPAERGDILDRNGRVLARTLIRYSVHTKPEVIRPEHRDAAAAVLARHLGSPERMSSIVHSGGGFVWIERMAPESLNPAIEALRADLIESRLTQYIGIDEEQKRVYPGGTLAGHVLGFTIELKQKDGETAPTGVKGVEQYLNRRLRGRTLTQPAFRTGLMKRSLAKLPERPSEIGRNKGATVTLTIDRGIQYVAESELALAVEEFEADGGAVVVVDPTNGEVLALALTPPFDPNEYSSYGDESRRNLVVDNVYDPGSTFKAITFAAALDAGVITPDDPFDCEGGRYRTPYGTITDHHPYGVLTAAEVLMVSSNIGTVKVESRLGRERFFNYIQAFGFGRKTGIQLPRENAGLVIPADRWYPRDEMNIAFGHGLSASPIQTVMAFAAIANDGVLMRPTLIKTDGKGRQVRRVISVEASRTLRRLLAAVVTKKGTASRAAIPGIEIGGKTGTAMQLDPETKRYSSRLWFSSFIGFLPAEAPRYVIGAFVDRPRGTWHTGGMVGAPLFRRVAEGILRLRGELPAQELVATLLPDRAAAEAAREGATPAAGDPAGDEGAGPEPGPGQWAMPDFTGLTIADVFETAGDRIRISVSGSGRAVDQSIPAGTIQSGWPVECRVRFARD